MPVDMHPSDSTSATTAPAPSAHCLPCCPLRVPTSPPPSTSSPPLPPTPPARANHLPAHHPPGMQLSLLAKSRRRRKIRQALERVARTVSSPRIAHDAGLALFSGTDCAVLTAGGEVIAARSGSARPLAALAPKLRHAAEAAVSLAAQLGVDGGGAAVHVRGRGALLLVYALGQSHALVAVTEVSPGARDLDAVIARIDAALGAAPPTVDAIHGTTTLVAELTALLRDL